MNEWMNDAISDHGTCYEENNYGILIEKYVERKANIR